MNHYNYLQSEDLYQDCRLCPRLCGVDRTAGRRGFCGEIDRVRVSVATLHRGEEPPISAGSGSGAVFFTGCTLRCAFCQNCQLSRGQVGRDVSVGELAEIFIALQERGAANVNLVTATHVWPSVTGAVQSARAAGLTVPVVWNSSGYERIDTLECFGGSVDVWLTDLKTLDLETSRELFYAADYPERASTAAEWMAGNRWLRYEGDRLMSGCVVRHLVLPERLEQTRQVLHWFAQRIGDRALLSLMVQYQPVPSDGRGPSELLTEREYDCILMMLDESGIENGFIQEYEGRTDWLPDFTRDNPFPEEFSDVVWHWRRGFEEKDR